MTIVWCGKSSSFSLTRIYVLTKNVELMPGFRWITSAYHNTACSFTFLSCLLKNDLNKKRPLLCRRANFCAPQYNGLRFIFYIAAWRQYFYSEFWVLSSEFWVLTRLCFSLFYLSSSSYCFIVEYFTGRKAGEKVRFTHRILPCCQNLAY